MIIGGASGALLAGGGRAGYSEQYLPCSAFIVPAGYKAVIEQTTRAAVKYSASARIRNVADTAWINLSSVSYFQVTKNSDGSLWTADVTVQAPTTWSPYISGGTYEDVLKPSNRRLQLWCGITVSGTTYSYLLFTGHVISYQEAVGASGGAINLRLEDAREIQTRTDSATLSIASATIFRAMQHQVMSTTQASRPYQGLHAGIEDQEIEVETVGPLSYDNAQAVIDGLIPGKPLQNLTPGNLLKLSYSGISAGEDTPAFTYSDANIISLQRFGGSNNFNAARIYGLSGSTVTTDETFDAADVAKRGKIYYAAGLIGSPYIQLTEAESIADACIAEELRGKVSVEVLLNPLIEPGQLLTVGSSRYSVASGTAIVRRVNHQYAVGRARSYMGDLILA